MWSTVFVDAEAHHALSPSGCRRIEDVVVSNITLRRFPVDPQGVGGGVADLKVLDTTEWL